MGTSGGIFLIKTIGVAEPVSVDLLELKKADLIIRALNHKLRLAILKLLADRPNSPVTSIYVKLRIEQSVASQHLAILRRAGIVTTKREGKFVYYTIDVDRIQEIQKIAKSLLG